MLSSLDGKISTGAADELDFDRDLPEIKGVCEGLYQYYEIEQTTDLWSLNSGGVQAKFGVNERPKPEKSPVSFVLIDNTHLKEDGIRYFSALSQTFVLITENKNHPAFSVSEPNLHIILQDKLNVSEALCTLYREFGCESLTVQSGGTLNSIFLREGLFDFIDLVIAPVLVGGKDTSTVIDGESLLRRDELCRIAPLRLLGCEVLKDSYVRLRYEVIK